MAGRLSEYQREALARMAVSGHPKARIARALGITPATVTRYLEEDPDIFERMEDARAREQRALANHHFEMMDMLEDARSAIQDGIKAQDARLRVETARWLIERIVPNRDPQEVAVTVQGSMNHEVGGTLQAILGHVVQIQQRVGQNGNARMLDRVRTGPTALPGVTIVPPQISEPPPVEGATEPIEEEPDEPNGYDPLVDPT